jgi:integrase
MRAMKLPHVITRRYTNKEGATWIGYYHQPPRGADGKRPKPTPLGSHLVTGKGPHSPPPGMLAAYAKLTGKDVEISAKDGTVANVYERYLKWAREEVRAGRLGSRTLADYESHWIELKPVFAGGQANALTQPILLGYFDRRSSKDRGKREVCFLGVLCGWARARGYMTAPNPVDRGLRKQMKVPKTVAPVVSADAYQVVWHCGDQLVRDTLDLALMAGCRPSEALRVPMPEAGWTELELAMDKTKRSGRPAKRLPKTPALEVLIERRRQLQPHSLYVLFDEKGQQLRANGSIRSRLLKARDLAAKVCKEAGIGWTDVTLQRLRPTAVTQVDKDHGREEARKLAGHTTEKQTAHYIRHEAEMATPAALFEFDPMLLAKIEQAKAELTRKESE